MTLVCLYASCSCCVPKKFNTASGYLGRASDLTLDFASYGNDTLLEARLFSSPN